MLFDAMLWLGLGLTIAAVAMALFLTTWGAGETAQAQTWVNETAHATMGAYMSKADFSLLNQSSAESDGLFPQASYAQGVPVNPWGGDFALSGADSPVRPMGAAVITMDQVPTSECQRLAASLAVSADSISVDGTTVSTGHSTPDPQVLSTACATQGRLQFSFFKR